MRRRSRGQHSPEPFSFQNSYKGQIILLSMAIVKEVPELIDFLPEVVVSNLGLFVTILKALGIVAILYVIYIAVSLFLNWKKFKRLGRIEKKIEDMDKKLSFLIKFRKDKKKAK